MIDPIYPPDLFTELRDLKMRLHALESIQGYERQEAVMLPATTPYTPPYVEITSGSYTVAWERRILDVRADSIYLRVTTSAGASTTGDIILDIHGGSSTDAQSVTSSVTVLYYRWTPDPAEWPIGGNNLLQLEARRLTGSNPLYIYPPTLLVSTAEELQPIVSGGIASS